MGFYQSSTNVSLKGTQLRAQCIDQLGVYHDSVLDINNYINNDNGSLRWTPGDFSATSKDLILEGNVLKCQCRDRQGKWCSSQLDLNDKIFNFNGGLVHESERPHIQVDDNNIEVGHHSDVIMSAMASEITGVSSVCLTVYSGADQRKHQSSASGWPLWGDFTNGRWIPRTKGQ